MIEWDCPYCGEHLFAEVSDGGVRFDCNRCMAMLRVPGNNGQELNLQTTRPARWWHFGLLGGVTLSIMTGVKAVLALVRNAGLQADLVEAGGFAAAIFGIGFLCGVVVWCGRGLHQRFGMIGDAIVGFVVMEVYFATCMLLFDLDAPKLLFLGIAAPIGIYLGISIGRDIRKESR